MLIVPIAPSSAFDLSALKKGVKILKSLSYCFSQAHLDHALNYQTFNWEYHDEFWKIPCPKEPFIYWNVRGGYGAINYLERYKLKLVQSSAKAAVGFSDFSLLLFNLANKCQAVHGANLVNLHGLPKEDLNFYSPEKLLDRKKQKFWLQKQHQIFQYSSFAITNLTVLASACGTNFFPNQSFETIAFEDVGEKPYRLVRCLTQLKQSGFFKSTKEIIFGDLDIAEFGELKRQMNHFMDHSIKLNHWPHFGHNNQITPMSFILNP